MTKTVVADNLLSLGDILYQHNFQVVCDGRLDVLVTRLTVLDDGKRLRMKAYMADNRPVVRLDTRTIDLTLFSIKGVAVTNFHFCVNNGRIAALEASSVVDVAMEVTVDFDILSCEHSFKAQA